MFLCDCPQHTPLGVQCGGGLTAMSAGGIRFAIAFFGFWLVFRFFSFWF